MTIFDSIKYPIIDIPTYSYLRTIPEPIITQWFYQLNPEHSNLTVNPSEYFSDRIIISKHYVDEAVALLRKIIREYED